MHSRGALTTVDALITGREATPEELTTDIGYTRDHIYQLLNQLIAAGLLHESRRHHNQRVVLITEHPIIEQYRKLRSKPYITNQGNRGIELDNSEFGHLADVLYHECDWEPFEIKSRLKHYEGWETHDWA